MRQGKRVETKRGKVGKERKRDEQGEMKGRGRLWEEGEKERGGTALGKEEENWMRREGSRGQWKEERAWSRQRTGWHLALAWQSQFRAKFYSR